METAKTVRLLRAATKAHIPVLLWGEPGTGKSSLVTQLAHTDNVPFEVVIASVREPADFLGLPVIDADTRTGVRFAAPDWAVRLCDAQNGIVFFDEMSCAPRSVQAAMLRVVCERMVGDMQLPDTVTIIGAANPSDQAAEGFELSAAMANRWCHIPFDPPASDWQSGMMNGFASQIVDPDVIVTPTNTRFVACRAQVVAFIRHRPELLHAVPKDAHSAGMAWPSRRTWDATARLLAWLPNNAIEERHFGVCGLVSEPVAIEFLEWIRYTDLPDPEWILENPDDVNWGDRPDRVFAMLAAIIGLIAPTPTPDLFIQACKVFGVAAGAGVGDIAAATATDLLQMRPHGTPIPDVWHEFMPMMAEAGLV